MSCPDCSDWAALVAHRYAGANGEPPAEWHRALAHLETCADCRRTALEHDPTLLFKRLGRRDGEPQPAVDPAVDLTVDVNELRLSLRAMRRTRALTTAVEPRGPRPSRVAAALLLAVAALLLGGTPTAPPVPGLAVELPVATSFLGHPWIPQSEVAAPPFVEAVGRPGARIYQLGEDDLSLVMIVDENLDV